MSALDGPKMNYTTHISGRTCDPSKFDTFSCQGLMKPLQMASVVSKKAWGADMEEGSHS